MNPLLESLLTASWQAAVIALLVLLVQRIGGRWLAPRWRYALWGLVVVRLLLPALPASPFSAYSIGVAESAPAVVATKTERPATPPPGRARPDPLVERVTPNSDASAPREAATPVAASVAPTPDDDFGWLTAAWALGAAAFLALALLRTRRLRRRLRRACDVEDPRVLALVEDAADRVGVRRPIRVVQTEAVTAPAVTGALRPCLLLPPTALASLDESELRFVLLHELEHVRRRDLLANWGLTLIHALHWFNPVVAFAFQRLRADRESARDLDALRHVDAASRVEYGHTILKLIEHGSARSRPALVAILGGGGDVKRRISMIANFSDRTRGGRVLALAFGLLIAVFALTSPDPAAGSPPKEIDPIDRAPADVVADEPADVPEDVVETEPEVPLRHVSVERRESPEKWRAALLAKVRGTQISLRLVETPVTDAIQSLRSMSGLAIHVDDDARYELEQTLSLSLTDVPLSTALDMITRFTDLSWGLRDRVVVISEAGRLSAELDERIYDLRPLLESEVTPPILQSLVGTFVQPESWEEEGARMRSWEKLLIVRQRPDVHAGLEAFLNLLLNRGERARARPSARRTATEASLGGSISLNTKDGAIEEVADFVAKTTGLSIVVDPRLDTSEAVTIRLENVPVRTVLQILARQTRGYLNVDEGVVQIAPWFASEVRIYDVSDLEMTDESTKSFQSLIRESVDDDSWDELPRTTVVDDLLIVRQSTENHAKIESLLTALRRALK